MRTRRSVLAAAVASVSLAGCSHVRDGGDGPAADSSGRAGSDGAGTEDDGAGAGSDRDDDSAVPEGFPSTVTLEPVAEGLESPVAFADLPTADRRFVLEQPGRIVVLGEDGPLEEPALDVTSAVRSGGEMGLLGIALHPDVAENRRAFVRYSAPRRTGTPDGYSHTFVLAEFEVSEDGQRIDRDSERTILEIPQPQANHNAGDLAFGPEGLLYVPTGDGGGAGDRGRGHPEDWYDGVAGGNGQDVTEHLLGGLLRIDVDADPTEHPRTDADAPAEPSGDSGYAIPAANPLVGEAGREEYFAWGLRNPWRLTFDDERLFVADVGQDEREEVDLVERGGNYGWNVREGTACYETGQCPDRVPESVPAPRGGQPLLDPIVEYSHDGDDLNGISVVGGHVYRGNDVDGLDGTYVFGDLRPDGRLFAALQAAEGDQWTATTIDYQGALVTAIYAIERDGDGELYVLGSGSADGTVWRVQSGRSE